MLDETFKNNYTLHSWSPQSRNLEFVCFWILLIAPTKNSHVIIAALASLIPDNATIKPPALSLQSYDVTRFPNKRIEQFMIFQIWSLKFYTYLALSFPLLSYIAKATYQCANYEKSKKSIYCGVEGGSFNQATHFLNHNKPKIVYYFNYFFASIFHLYL